MQRVRQILNMGTQSTKGQAMTTPKPSLEALAHADTYLADVRGPMDNRLAKRKRLALAFDAFRPATVGDVEAVSTAEKLANRMGATFEVAAREVEKLSRDLDITNADHIALWIEQNTILDEPMSRCASWLACRIAEAHEAAISAMGGVTLDEGEREELQQHYFRQGFNQGHKAGKAAMGGRPDKLREALAFYAREQSWRSSGVYMSGKRQATAAELDAGGRARAALVTGHDL